METGLLFGEATNPKFGDYQCNNAMPIAAKLKALGQPTKPADIGQKIVENIEQCPLIQKMEVMPQGFINVHLDLEHIKKLLADIAKEVIRSVYETAVGSAIATVCEASCSCGLLIAQHCQADACRSSSVDHHWRRHLATLRESRIRCTFQDA